MPEDNIQELGNHIPTVESIITRLHRHMGRIKSITAVIQWDDGARQITDNDKPISELCFDATVLNHEISKRLSDCAE